MSWLALSQLGAALSMLDRPEGKPEAVSRFFLVLETKHPRRRGNLFLSVTEASLDPPSPSKSSPPFPVPWSPGIRPYPSFLSPAPSPKPASRHASNFFKGRFGSYHLYRISTPTMYALLTPGLGHGGLRRLIEREGRASWPEGTQHPARGSRESMVPWHHGGASGGEAGGRHSCD